jgi:hypothetical protein
MKTSLMALRAGRPEHTPEAEPVLIDTDTPGVVRLVLDDGDVVELDAIELRAAMRPTRTQAA